MMRVAILSLLFSCLAASGCRGTELSAVTPYAPMAQAKLTYAILPNVEVKDEAMTIFRERLDAQLASAGLLAQGTEPARLDVLITIENYYMRNGATRTMVGVLAGADNIRSRVQVLDRTTQALIGECVVESSNPTAWGTVRALLQMHADKVVEFLKSGGS